jgi:POT family proton-dependent oligopeptide transporter
LSRLAGEETDLFGHPRGLAVLFLTEMWEKFSFFGMRALLIYYMIDQLLFEQGQASLIYGGYAAAVYLTPIFGGYVSDRWLGRRRAVIAGGSIMAIGHFLLASETLFFPALAAIAIGNGLFLPSLPGQIGGLYQQADPRRGGAYNVYYVGVNLGAFLAPLICGTLGEVYGWHWGFGAAGVGMLLGLSIYIGGRRWLPADPPQSTAMGVAGIRELPMGPIAATLAAVILFRAAYEQTGNTLAVWISEAGPATVASHAIPATWFQALGPFFIFLLTPALVRHWRALAERNGPANPLLRMAAGAGIVATAYTMLAALAPTAGAGGPMLSAALLLFFLILTLGELHILPVGLGLFAGIGPAGAGATMIALWFLGSFFGNLLGGSFGTLWGGLAPAHFFLAAGAIAAVSGLMLLGLGRRGLPSPAGAA